MRILCQLGQERSRSIYEGWGRVFAAAGHDFTLWDPATKPAFDAFDETNPQLYVHTGDGYRSASKCIMERAQGQMQTLVDDDPQPAADTFLYMGGQHRHDRSCDYAYVGSYREDKRKLLDAYVGAMTRQGNTKLFGDGPWPYHQYLGPVTDETARDIYASARVNLSVSATGRTPQRVYHILLAGGLCVSNRLTDAVFEDGLVAQADNAVQFVEKATLASKRSESNRKKIGDWGREVVLSDHTYWHRCRDLFMRVGFHAEAERLIKVYHETVRV